MKARCAVALDDVACGGGDAETGLMEPPRLLHIQEHVGHRRARPRPNLFTKHNVRSSVNFSEK